MVRIIISKAERLRSGSRIIRGSLLLDRRVSSEEGGSSKITLSSDSLVARPHLNQGTHSIADMRGQTFLFCSLFPAQQITSGIGDRFK